MSDMSFIDAVSGIVNRGCHNPPCGTGPLDGAYERKENFIKVLSILLEENGDPRIPNRPTVSPTIMQTNAWDNPSTNTWESNTSNNNPAPWESNTSTNNPAPDSVEIDYGSANESAEIDSSSTNNSVGGKPTNEPSSNDLDNGDENWVDTDEEDLATSGQDDSTSSMNLWCGSTQFDATRNCGTGTACPGGICPDGLKCFMISSLCGDFGSGTSNTNANEDNNEEGTINTEPTTPSPVIFSPTVEPTSAPSAGVKSDVTDSYFCGKDRADASAGCYKRCRSGQPSECPR